MTDRNDERLARQRAAANRTALVVAGIAVAVYLAFLASGMRGLL